MSVLGMAASRESSKLYQEQFITAGKQESFQIQ